MSTKPWYPRYPADLRAKTMHLNLTERGAYDALLDHYYQTRQPLPCEMSILHRICCAFSSKEKQAVNRVAAEFFINGDGKLRHQRCDEELDKMRLRSEQQAELARRRWKKEDDAKASAKASATAYAGNMLIITHNLKKNKSIGAKSARTEFIVSDEMSSWASKQGLPADSVMSETTKFFDHHLAKGSAFSDWDAAWRNWIRNAVKFAKT